MLKSASIELGRLWWSVARCELVSGLLHPLPLYMAFRLPCWSTPYDAAWLHVSTQGVPVPAPMAPRTRAESMIASCRRRAATQQPQAPLPHLQLMLQACVQFGRLRLRWHLGEDVSLPGAICVLSQDPGLSSGRSETESVGKEPSMWSSEHACHCIPKKKKQGIACLIMSWN